MKYTDTEMTMLKLLGDGLAHGRLELQGTCPYAETNKPNTFSVHLNSLRQKLYHESMNGGTLLVYASGKGDRTKYQLIKATSATISDIKSLNLHLHQDDGTA